MDVKTLIGENVKQARVEAGLSQKELGERVAGVLGKDQRGKDRIWLPQAVSAAEKGGRDWAAEDLVAVAWVLKRPVASFFKVPDGANPWDVLDVDGGESLHLAWVSGEETAQRTVENLAAEIERLTRQLRRAVLAEGDTVEFSYEPTKPKKRRTKKESS